MGIYKKYIWQEGIFWIVRERLVSNFDSDIKESSIFVGKIYKVKASEFLKQQIYFELN